MYITITPQKLDGSYCQSVADFVDYLEKENQYLQQENPEHFFNQYGEQITAKEVIRGIDANTAKLKQNEPKFYSITVSPSRYELSKLKDCSADLKRYTRELMKEYASCFNREINGRPAMVNDIKYYAKIEHQRTYKGSDKEVRENQAFASKILNLKTELRKIRGEIQGDIKKIERRINRLETAAPHKTRGERIVQGMLKEGRQSHVHIIVSRKDMTNSYSLSPGSKYKASEVMINGKLVKRGFDRDAFFSKAEKAFDKKFGYSRNYVETYGARKNFTKNPKLYFQGLARLPISEKTIAFKMLRKQVFR